MHAIRRSLVLAGLLGLVALGSVAAQTVRGRVVETMSGVAVGGGFVVLVAADGREVSRTLADREGRFAIRAPSPGRYRLRSERIGFRMVTSEPFDLGADEAIEQQLDVKAVPIRLDEVRITSESQCKVKPDGHATATVWEEARKALAAVAWSQRQQLLRATIRTFERDIEPDLTVKSESTQVRTGYTTRPFHARSAAQLAAEGYVTAPEKPDTAYTFYAPDADVLFSEEFLNTHCFRIEQGGPMNPGRIGLAFEPIGKRTVSDIHGVMWLEEKSAELEAVEFQYVNTRLPGGESDRAGGRVEFQQLVNGVWVVDNWYIRMPVFGLVDGGDVSNLDVRMGSTQRRVGTSSNQRRSVEIVSFREEGGEILDVFDRDGRRLAGTAGATLAGSVFDSTRATPLIGATVRIIGTGRFAETGPNGRFRMDRLPEGAYELEFYHDEFPAWGVLRTGVTVRLQRGEVTETRLAVPPANGLLAMLCPTMPADSDYAVAGGTVTDAETGAAVPGARVQITWRDYQGVAKSQKVVLNASTSGLQTETNAAGYFRVCGLPTRDGGLLQAEVVFRTRVSPAVEFRVGPGELKEVNLMVSKP